jgi:D-arginine dehydrogenase
VLRRLDEAATRELCPALRPGYLVAAALEEDAQDLDVAGLFEHCRRRARRGGAQIVTGARVRSGSGGESGWRLQTDAGEVSAGRVVNAAGAWADEIAGRLGVVPVGLTPFRRTVAVATSDAIDRGWPLVGDVGETFYCRPEGTGLLLSPADETPSEPCDARAEVEDVALALDRVNEATTLGLRHVRATWAGLRTFAPDRNPVIGFDPANPGFFWLAGQGGYGMQTAPAVAVLAAALLRGEAPPAALGQFDLGRVSPARLTGSDPPR